MSELALKYTHLYYERYRCSDYCSFNPHDCYEVMACPVTRVTAKRIYFRGADNGTKYLRETEFLVDRVEIEANGFAYSRRMRQTLHLEPLATHPRLDEKQVAELRKEAADAHPDRGGDPEEFRTAYARYAAARKIS